MAKNLIPISAALAAMLCITMSMRGDSPPEHSYEIPIKVLDQSDLIRNNCEISARYNAMMSVVQTYVISDLGEINVTVTNRTTGDMWYDVFDSSSVLCHNLLLTGMSGSYEIVYSTESGKFYEGFFVIY